MEPRLRCDSDATLLARPTPWASVTACVRGLWTPRTARLIRLAERVPPIGALQPLRKLAQHVGLPHFLRQHQHSRNNLERQVGRDLQSLQIQ